MTAQLTPASGRDDRGLPRSRTGSYGTVIPDVPETSDAALGVGVRPGESDPVCMLAAVLVLVMGVVIMALALAWWLA
jgi:hypothetical protein